MASTYEAQQEIWLQQFAQVDAILVTTWQQLQSQHCLEANPHLQVLEPQAFPVAWDAHRLLSKLKRDKVPSPNQVPPNFLKA